VESRRSLREAQPGLVQDLTESLQDAIVNKHNELRAGVTVPCTASDMVELEWDADLAIAASAWVRTNNLFRAVSCIGRRI
jgi:uncharacterized protein YkwD